MPKVLVPEGRYYLPSSSALSGMKGHRNCTRSTRMGVPLFTPCGIYL